jgi:hypothetical protein
MASEDPAVGSEIAQQLQKCYGTHIRPHRLTLLSNKHQELLRHPTRFCTEDAELSALLGAIQWHVRPPRLFVAFDPFVGTGNIRTFFDKHRVPLSWVTNDADTQVAADFNLDAVSASNWTCFPLADFIICSPPWELLDVVLPVCAEQAMWFSAIHTQGDFISSAPVCRQTYLRMLAEQGRLCTIQGLPRAKSRNLRNGIWLLIFKDTYAKNMFWHPNAEVSMAFEGISK